MARYLGSLLRGHPEPTMGHNPAGAVAIVALLALAAAVSASGWAIYNDVGGGWVEDVHEVAANLMLAVVGVHVAGVLASSWLHRENLVGAMIDGRKRGDARRRRSPCLAHGGGVDAGGRPRVLVAAVA